MPRRVAGPNVIVSLVLFVPGALQAQECYQWREDARPLEPYYYPRYESVVYDSIRSMTVVVGGYDGAYLESNETWGWDGAQWSLLDVGGMPGRSFASGSFDSDRGRIVIFGGRGMDNVAHGPRHGDTWEWDGAEWSLRSDTGPLPRWGHCMAYDSARKVTLLFGGEGSYGFLGALWGWDGTTWKLLNGEGPPPRAFSGCAFDSYRGVFVISGGFREDDYNSLHDDTWEWNGSSWRWADDSGLVARAYAAMTFDESRKFVFLQGGLSGETPSAVGDFWVWNGAQWTNVAVPQVPHLAHGMIYDSTSKRIVMVGGIGTETKLFELIHVDSTADADGDCDLDIYDFAGFQACAGEVFAESECWRFDVDQSGQVDATDLAEWFYSLTGPGK